MSGTTLDKVSLGLQNYDLKQDIAVERTGDVIAYKGTVASPSPELLAAAGFEASVKKMIFTRMWGKPQDFYFYRDGKEKKLISTASWDGTDYIDLILPIGTGNINVEFVDNKTKYKLDVSGVK